ncbi:DUF4229 domain-containing protein [Arthrobacter sp. NPDC097144]|uniref:DUF4229 domain-containing protein n=1 Tax=Arthrobacter sp. NPDC097144 TaxID=3363946 RepID=UPI00381D1266
MAFWKFTALRLGLVAVFFAACVWLGLGLVLSAIVGAVLAWCVTYLFFRDMRDAAARNVQKRFHGDAPRTPNRVEREDASAEDSLLDSNPEVQINSDRRPRDEQQP